MRVLTVSCAVAIGLAVVPSLPARGSAASDILNLTGGKRVRVVWSRDTVSPYNHTFGGANVYKLMGMDTAENGGAERVVVGTVSDYSQPRLNHDGTLIVYTNYVTNKVYLVNWDGTNNREILSNARHGCFWYDTGSSTEYVVYQTPVGEANPLWRVNVNNTSSKQQIYSARSTTIDWFSISPDGTRLGGSFPWSSCGIVDLTNTTYVEYASGCWASVSPDSLYRCTVFDGAHRNWNTWDAGKTNPRVLNLNGGPGVDSWEIYHPRFAVNDTTFFTVNGPYSVGSMGGNNIGNGGAQVELYFGRFSSGLTTTEGYAKLTSNSEADFFGHSWIDLGGTPGVSIDSFSASPATIAQGASSTLTWATSNATSVTLNASSVALDGTQSVSPASTTTYTLVATNTGGSTQQQVTVTVQALRDPENPGGATNGLDVRYYDLTSPTVLPNFGGMSAFATGTVAQIAYASTSEAFASSGRTDNVGAVFEGYVQVPSDGIYTFSTESDDGSSLRIGTTEVVDNDGLHGMQERSGQIGLKAGVHAFAVEFFEATGGAGVIVRYEGPGITKQTIPAAALWRVAGAAPVLTSITVSPAAATVGAGGTQVFTAQPLDQYGAAIAATVGWAVDGGGGVSPSTGASTTFTAGSTPGAWTVTATSGGVSGSATVVVGALHLKVNCGSNSYDVAGWERDDDYVVGGTDYTFGGTADLTGVANAAPAAVYKSCRHRDYTNTYHSYSFAAVPNGTYTVRMHFYDEYGGGRAMTYTIEGVDVRTGFAITPTGSAVVEDFTVTVSDGDGLQIVGDVGAGNDVFECGIEIIAGGGANTAPTASAGADATVQLGVAATLDGTVADDGLPGGTLTTAWSTQSGPGAVSFADAASVDTTATFAAAGTYVLRLTASDGALSSYDDVTITVTEPSGPSITLISPNGGEVWYAGQTHYVRWMSFNLTNATIYYSTDNGVHVSQIVSSVLAGGAGWLDYPWTVPDEPSTACLVTISGYFGESPTESAGTFEIRHVTDMDTDGMDDAWELARFGGLAHDGLADSDADGLTDLEEFEAGTDPTQADGDGDGMSDLAEVTWGTNPVADDAAYDYDRDGYSNGTEVAGSSDPRDAASVPGAGGGSSTFGCVPAAGGALSGAAVWAALAAIAGLGARRRRG